MEVSINGWMDKENIIFIYNGILLISKKERNLAISDNIIGTWGYYVKYNEIYQKKTNSVWSLSYVKAQISQAHRNRVEWWLPGLGVEVRDMERDLSKSTKKQRKYTGQFIQKCLSKTASWEHPDLMLAVPSWHILGTCLLQSFQGKLRTLDAWW